MGSQQRQRGLKPSKEYCKLDLLSVKWVSPRGEVPGRLVSVDRPHWDAKGFADSCSGCHTTAVDPKEKAFSAVSLDCVACHGSVPAEHAKMPEPAHLSPKRAPDVHVVTSICAQCHVRTGRSKDTGRPYPTNFVAGDNLFRDFQADFSDASLAVLSSAGRTAAGTPRPGRRTVVRGQGPVGPQAGRPAGVRLEGHSADEPRPAHARLGVRRPVRPAGQRGEPVPRDAPGGHKPRGRALADFASWVDPEGREVLVLQVDHAGGPIAEHLAIPLGVRLHHLPGGTPEQQPVEHLWSLVGEGRAKRCSTSWRAGRRFS
jgi:hypothetical protein